MHKVTSTLFKMTEPQSWQLLRAINVGATTPGLSGVTQQFEFVDGQSEQYGETEFGLVETKLKKIGLSIMKANDGGDTTLGDVAE